MKKPPKNSPFRTKKQKNSVVYLFVLLTMMVSGCGNKGDLYHPQDESVDTQVVPSVQVTANETDVSI